MIIINQISLCPCDEVIIRIVRAQKIGSPEFHEAALKATPEWKIDDEDRWTLSCPKCGRTTASNKNQLRVREGWNKTVTGAWVFMEMMEEDE